MQFSRVRYRLRSLMVLVVAGAIGFAVWQHFDAQYRSTANYQLRELAFDLANAARLEVVHLVAISDDPAIDRSAWFCTIDGQPELKLLSDSETWPQNAAFYKPNGLAVGGETHEYIFVQIVSPTGSTRNLMLYDTKISFDGRNVATSVKKFQRALVNIIEQQRQANQATRMTGEHRLCDLFTGNVFRQANESPPQPSKE